MKSSSPENYPAQEAQSWNLLSPASLNKTPAAILLGGAVLLLFGPIILSGDLLVSMANGDLANQFYGWRQFGFSELAKGHLALWNPYVFCGAPYFAGFQSALLYPLNWFFLFLPLVIALNFSMALHVFLAGFFTYLWLASNRLSFLSALFGAFVFMFGGSFFLHVYPGHLTNLCAMAWIPLVFLYVEKILEKPGLKNILLGSGVLSLQLLSGHPQYFLYTLLIAALYALALLFRNPTNLLQKISAGMGLGFLALGVTAIQWLPGLEAAKEFGRDLSLQAGDPNFFSISPLGLVSLLTPSFFGGLDPSSAFPNSRIWWEITPFIGAVAFLFVLNTLRKKGWVRNRIGLGLALLSLLLAMGHHTFLYPLLEPLPLFNSFRGSFKFLIFFQAFAALLSAAGLEALLRETLGNKTLFRWTLALSLVGILTLWGFAFSRLPAFPVGPFLAEMKTVKSNLPQNLEGGRLFWSAHNDRSLSLGLPDIWGDDPMVPKRLSAFITYSKNPSPNSAADTQVLNLTPVKGALTRLAFLIDKKNGQFQANPSPFPQLHRAFLLARWKTVNSLPRALETMSRPDFEPSTEVILEREPFPTPEISAHRGQVLLRDLTTDQVEVQVQTEKAQVLLMTDSYSQGWKAEALHDSDQQVYEVMPGDVFARAIPLSAGRHHFVLKYEPLGFVVGKWISLTTLLLYLFAWGWAWVRKMRT